ncbi:cysteine peptidase family C39 domain-containing protein [Nostoc sp. PCC 9305]|uniref:cysteine peptidase family C39 domain-containing protein n=1 Tax=Nostoc sp. PCC 9305 TaxID=296636 RepID=UPI0039C67AC8
MRLVRLPKSISKSIFRENLATPTPKTLLPAEIPYASEITVTEAPAAKGKQKKFPYIKGRGPLDATLAYFQMLSQYFNIFWRRDTLQRVLTKQYEHKGVISLQFCAAAAELIGLTTQMVKVPATAVGRLQLSVMISWQDSFAIIYKNSDRGLLIAVPEMGLLRYKLRDFAENCYPFMLLAS